MILRENKQILQKKGSENFEANKRNACETDLCSLRFALKRKKNISENRTPYSPAPVPLFCFPCDKENMKTLFKMCTFLKRVHKYFFIFLFPYLHQ
jgi:hypothetical protein